jgi:hypothetical protein
VATIGSINIGISASTEALSRDLNKGAAQVEGFAGRIKGLGSGLTSVVAGIGAAFAAAGAGAFLAKSVQAASDLNEQISKSQQVFGTASATVEADAKRMAEAFGVPRREFLEAASSIGLIAEGAGLSEAAAAKLGSQFGRLGIDVSSFFNVSTEEALGALRSGLTGEAEPLKRFGVLMNEDAVKAEALRLGIAGLNGKLSEAQKVQVRVSLITQGLAKATGDMARTADGAANQMRGFSGRLEELQVAAGEAIAPVTSAFLGLANEGIKAVSEAVLRNQGEIKAWAESAAESLKGLASGTGDLATAWDIFKTAVGAVRSAFLAVEEVSAAIVSEVARAAAKLTDLAALIPGLGPKSGFFDALADEANTLQERYHKAFRGIEDGSTRVAAAVEKQATAVKQAAQTSAPAVQTVTAALNQEAAAASKVADEMKKAQDELSRQALDVIQSVQTPLEKFGAELLKLENLSSKGLIDPEIFARAKKAAADEFDRSEADKAEAGALKPPGLDLGIPEKLNAAALEQGSKEARSAVLAARTGAGGDPLKSLDKSGKDSLAQHRQHTALLRQIASRPNSLEVLAF